MNLFWSTRSLTAAREDHLTEFFAAALEVSEPFRRAYADLVFRDSANTDSFAAAQIQNFTTQVSFPGTTCCPDIILKLSDGRTIACEHKLDALETMGPEKDSRSQLIRYLDLPIDGLIYVRTSWKPPASEVLNHPKYIHPRGREHFLWRDFYPILTCDNHAVLNWLREGFERLGFTPPHPSIGDLSGSDEDLNRENRRNFAKLWQRTRSIAHNLGWKVDTGSIIELYLSGNANSLDSSIFISPAKYDRFLFRVTPLSDNLRSATNRLREVCNTSGLRTDIAQHRVKRKDGEIEVLDITTSLREILGKEKISPEEIEERLSNFVEPLLHAIKK